MQYDQFDLAVGALVETRVVLHVLAQCVVRRIKQNIGLMHLKIDSPGLDLRALDFGVVFRANAPSTS